MPSPARIIRAQELSQMRDAERTLEDAKAEAKDIIAKAQADADAERTEVMAKAVSEAEATAKDILDKADSRAQAELGALEGEVSELVAATVSKVIGDMDQTTAIKAATKTALSNLAVQKSAKIRAAPEVFRAVSDAVSEGDGPDTRVPVTQDEGLTGDRVILSSDRGHTEIGLSDQLAAVTEPWRGAS